MLLGELSCCTDGTTDSCRPRLRAQVDRIEEEIMRLVPGVRYVDLETDRGRFSTYARGSIDHHDNFDTFPTVNEIAELQRGSAPAGSGVAR
jgi:hypothetical protein